MLFIIQTTRKPESKSDRGAAGGGVRKPLKFVPPQWYGIHSNNNGISTLWIPITHTHILFHQFQLVLLVVDEPIGPY